MTPQSHLEHPSYVHTQSRIIYCIIIFISAMLSESAVRFFLGLALLVFGVFTVRADQRVVFVTKAINR